MKPYIVAVALAVLILCGTQTAQAGHPGYGWHGDANGNGELVLDYQHARDFANSLGGSPYDPNVQRTKNTIISFAAKFGGRAIPIASAFFTGVDLVLAANRAQMREATAVANYEAYGFKMYRWVPYWGKRYSFDDYTLLREDGNPGVYVVVADAKFWVPNGSYFNYEWNRIKVVPRGRLSNWYQYPKGGALLREQSNPAVNWIVYAAINPQYTWVSRTNQQGWVRRVVSYNAFNRLGFKWSDVRVVPNGAFNQPNPYLPRGYDAL